MHLRSIEVHLRVFCIQSIDYCEEIYYKRGGQGDVCHDSDETMGETR